LPGRPGIIDRPNVGNLPTLRPDGNHNTIINNRPINTNINNINYSNTNINNINYSNITNVQNRANYINNGVVGSAYRPWVNNALYGYHNNWQNQFSYWRGGCHPWYHGYWHGCGYNPWGIGVGTGWLNAWALSQVRYGWGYYSYVNPFYVAPVQQAVYLNYSQPITSPATSAEGQPPPEPPTTASQYFDAARASFQAGDYRTAQTQVELSLKEFPTDPVAHEFRALVLFALGEYRSAAAAIHAVLAAGPGWDWTTMSSLYAERATYRQQLQALESAVAAVPNDPALHFLLAYHLATATATEDAKKEYEIVHKLLPNDEVTTQVLRVLAGDDSTTTTAPTSDPQTQPADLKLDINGKWMATRSDGGIIGLKVAPDGKFEWSVYENGKKDSFDGTFGLEDDMMVLKRSAGGTLTGKVEALANDKFRFKALGGPDNDPGLTFEKK
jgi:tetratricopeptide (TPR) repeat protein